MGVNEFIQERGSRENLDGQNVSCDRNERNDGHRCRIIFARRGGEQIATESVTVSEVVFAILGVLVAVTAVFFIYAFQLSSGLSSRKQLPDSELNQPDQSNDSAIESITHVLRIRDQANRGVDVANESVRAGKSLWENPHSTENSARNRAGASHHRSIRDQQQLGRQRPKEPTDERGV